MADGYQRFLDFDWSDEGWEAYLKNLYPPPNQRQLGKFKKKWYKKHVDPEFDDTYEPPGAGGASSSSSCASAAAATAAANGTAPIFPPVESSRWRKMGRKAAICAAAHGLAMTGAVGATAGALPAYQALVVLVAAFALELLAKYGLKFNNTYVQSVLLDDVGVMPMMSLTLLTPGLHPAIRILALVPSFLTSLLSFSQICKEHPGMPPLVRDFFSPLADNSARYQVMQVRAHVEVLLGFSLIVGVCTVQAAPISMLLFWNFMMMRYMMNPWTQSTFRRIDNCLHPVFSRIPGVANLYAATKRGLYSFVDPASSKKGKICSIL